MSTTSLVVLTAQRVALGPASAYATRLANTMGVPLRLLPASFAEAPWPTLHGAHEPAWPAAPPETAARPGSLAATLAAQRALLLVLPRPTSAEAPPGWLPALVATLLQTVTQPLLVVPPQATGRVPPLRMLLAADGEPFRLGPGRRAMHALFFTLPVRLTVLHVQLPGQEPAGAEALQSVLTCGLAMRSVATEGLEVAAGSAIEGILQVLAQDRADLLVLLVRPRSWRAGHFAQGTSAAVLQRSPAPVLLLPATEA